MDTIEAKKQAVALTDWLRERGVAFDDAVPILAMTAGLILGYQAAGDGAGEEEHLIKRIDEGVVIVKSMIKVAAIFEANRVRRGESRVDG